MAEKSIKKVEKQAESPKNTPFIEGVDFYIEKGLYVFTEKYLKKRGFCCDNGCRHCPYKKVVVK